MALGKCQAVGYLSVLAEKNTVFDDDAIPRQASGKLQPPIGVLCGPNDHRPFNNPPRQNTRAFKPNPLTPVQAWMRPGSQPIGVSLLICEQAAIMPSRHDGDATVKRDLGHPSLRPHHAPRQGSRVPARPDLIGDYMHMSVIRVVMNGRDELVSLEPDRLKQPADIFLNHIVRSRLVDLVRDHPMANRVLAPAQIGMSIHLE
jgi:hypothetical protein